MDISSEINSNYIDLISQMYYENPCKMIKNQDINETIGITVETCE